ncbi:MAG: hypothetical protein FWE08_00750 [Oscillospiraceae bacterium]|nr:hypothetical protein [Oscillospiraceae bacterium]
MRRKITTIPAVIFAVLILASLSACSDPVPEQPEPITAERLCGEWRKWFGEASVGQFDAFDSGVASVYFSDDGTGTYTDA